jgi:hypothetical protein
MSIIIHFFNGNDETIEMHYSQKEYRNDVIIEINHVFYEVYFFVKDALEYEMRKDGFFSLPGLIILDEISNDKIINAIKELFILGYFDSFKGYSDKLDNKFANKFYSNELSIWNNEKLRSLIIEI